MVCSHCPTPTQILPLPTPAQTLTHWVWNPIASVLVSVWTPLHSSLQPIFYQCRAVWTHHKTCFLPKWNRNSVNLVNSEHLINHWSMNCAQFKDPVSNMCLAGAMIASWSLTQWVAGSIPFAVMTNVFIRYREFTEFPSRKSWIRHW